MENAVRELRERNGLSQADLGRAVGVTRQTIISIEKGHYDPKLPLAFKLAAFFEVPVDDLFDPDILLDATVSELGR